MKLPLTVGALVLGTIAASGARAGDPPRQEAPTLVVMISVDQLRGDLLERYSDAFDGGFRRLLDEGYRFTGASHAHAVTHTAAGHATLATGVFPSRSGIVANNWSQRVGVTWVPMYAVEDSASPILGVEGLGGMSPRNLLRSGLADWVLAASSEARVVSIAGKDRAAITLAGQSRGEVYWVVPQLGRFVTSRYYRDSYPEWIERFNAEVMPRILEDSVWVQSVPEEPRGLARPDSAAYEGDGVHTAFPHDASVEVPRTDTAAVGGGAEAATLDWMTFNTWALAQPRIDRAVNELALRAIDELRLGTRGPVDFLALSFSAADHVGHAYGPLSQEQLDNLVRLDRELGRLFEHLDERVGPGRWVAGLSGDHGVQTMPEHVASEGGKATRVAPRERQAAMSEALREAAGDGGRPPEELAERLARLIEERGLVAKAYTIRDLTVGEAPDSFAALQRNSHYPGRATGWLTRFGVEFRFGYGELVHEPTGTTHGSPYWYDRHVPLILFGGDVRAGTSEVAAYTVDLAPTLAALTGIRTPDDLDGRVIYR